MWRHHLEHAPGRVHRLDGPPETIRATGDRSLTAITTVHGQCLLKVAVATQGKASTALLARSGPASTMRVRLSGPDSPPPAPRARGVWVFPWTTTSLTRNSGE